MPEDVELMKMKIAHEPHPFRWYIPTGATKLIIGTFPPITSRWAFAFFYPNARNLFWKILADVAGMTLSTDMKNAVEERKALLASIATGVTDMGGVICRTAQNSLDENLQLIEYMPILEILETHRSIERIILTSSSGRSSALAWFKLYLAKNGIECVVPKSQKPLRFNVCVHNRNIDVFVLYSPSPRASNRISFPKLADMYREALTEKKI